MPTLKRVLAIQSVGILFSGTCLLCSGCATGYLGNRLHDGADIFTGALGVGGGARVRVGPVHAGVLPFNIGDGGLRGGQWEKMVQTSGEADFFVIPLGSAPSRIEGPVFAAETYDPAGPAYRRGKGFAAYSRCPFVTTDLSRQDTSPNPARPYHYYTQIEATLGLGFTLKLGFNPGELLDFILGWATIDIFNDDLEK